LYILFGFICIGVTNDPRHYQIQLIPVPTTSAETVGRIDVYSRAPDELKKSGGEVASSSTPSVWVHHASMTTHFARGNGWFAEPQQLKVRSKVYLIIF
jgi:hypothetical protein